jgi:hypothetical protein
MLGMFRCDRHELTPVQLPGVLVLVFGQLLLAGGSGCGSHASARSDGAPPAAPGTGGAGSGTGGSRSGNGGAGGTDVASAPQADSAVVLADCPELPCLVPAANLITPCKPSYTCTRQTTGLTIVSCFDNGIKVSQSYGTGSTPSGHMIMAVKKDGASCYSLEVSSADADANQDILTYKDGAGTELLTIFARGADVTVTCPGAAPVALPSTGPCATASAFLGGLMPASSCIDSTTGTCTF